MIAVEPVGNRAGDDTRAVLRRLLRARDVSEVRVAISYVMASGTNILRGELERLVGRDVPVTVVFGDDFHLSQSTALRVLMDLGVDLRLFDSEAHSGYHPKLWVVDYGRARRSVLIGSSNLSAGGLIGNAEANVLLSGDKAELTEFAALWERFLKESRTFDEAGLASYEDAEQAAAAPSRVPGRMARTPDTTRPIRAHIERWQQLIPTHTKTGQAERWRGWYLVPEQGQLTPAKLRELAKILNAIATRREYAQRGALTLDGGRLGVANATAVLRAAGVTTHGRFSAAQRRNLFVRQQRLYLLTFGFLEKVAGQAFRITPEGDAFRRARGDSSRSRIFTRALEQKRWVAAPIAFYPFLRDLLERAPDHRLYYDELSLIVIHTYHRAELLGTLSLVSTYRALDPRDRDQLAHDADQHLRTLLDRHAGRTAYGRYRRKVADLLVAFGTTEGMRTVLVEPEDRSYVELV